MNEEGVEGRNLYLKEDLMMVGLISDPKGDEDMREEERRGRVN